MDTKNTLLDDISAVIGFTPTVLLASWFGGTQIRVVSKFDENHLVAKIIGVRAFERLVGTFGDTNIHIPKVAIHQRFLRWKRVHDLLLAGSSVNAIVEELGITIQHVHNIRRDLEDSGILPIILREPADVDRP